MVKITKKAVAFLLLTVMLLQMIPVIAFAAEDTMTLTVASVSGTPGEEVKVTVDVSDNPGIASLVFDVAYDSSLTLKGVKFNSEFGPYATTPQTYTNPQRITFISPLSDVTVNGVLATLTFEVSANAADGYEANVTVTYKEKDVYDSDYDLVPVNVVNGKVCVFRGIPGDINADKTVNTKDAILLFRYVAGWNVTVDPLAVDCNGDGIVDTRDAIELFRYTADWPDIKLYYATMCAHDLEYVEANEATCTEDGNVAHWHCDTCGSNYADVNGETKLDTFIVPASGHAMVYNAPNAPTCTAPGSVEYWHCSNCKINFADEKGEEKLDTVVIAKLGHNLEKVDKKGASCTESGNVTYWFCKTCEKSYADENATIELGDVMVSALGHKLSLVEAKDATHIADGNIEYWYCTACSSYFGDSAASNKIVKNDTVVPATGHGESLEHVDAKDATVYEKGNEEYWYCPECDKYYKDAEAKDEYVNGNPEIDILPYYTITFIDSFNWSSGKDIRFSQSERLALDSTYDPIYVEGYEFIGWSKMPQSEIYKPGEKMPDGLKETYIPANTTESFALNAYWRLKEYKITYKNAAENSKNPETYTIEDEIVLVDPEWIGLTFSRWTDEHGNEVTKIKQGTIGDITLEANWMHQENLAVPSNDTSVKAQFLDDETDRYYFVYDLGVIDNIVLKKVETQDKELGGYIEWTKSETVTIGSEISDTIARSTSTSVSNTREWSHLSTAVRANTETIGVSAELGKKDIFKLAGKYEQTNYNENTTEYGSSHSSTDSSENSSSVSSSFICSTGSSATVTTTTGVTENMPKGAYHNVAVAKIRVYAVVTYDTVTQRYYLNTYSVLLETRSKILYEVPSDCKANITYSEGLPFNVPLFEKDENGNLKTDENGDYIPGDIINYLNSQDKYYVKYDANGGDVLKAIPKSIFTVDEKANLPTYIDNFVRPGYVFAGWSLTPDGAPVYNDKAQIINIASLNQTVTLYAAWELIPYKVSWDTVTGCTITVNRTASTNKGAYIGKLSNGDIIYYGDKLTVTYEASTGYAINNHGSVSINVTENVDKQAIYATVSQIIYTITYDSAGGTGIPDSNYHYKDTTSIPADPTRTGYHFTGWTFYNKDGNKIDFSLGNQMPAYNITAKADWTLVLSDTYNRGSFYISKDEDDSNHRLRLTIYYEDVFDFNALTDAEYKMKVSVYYNAAYKNNEGYIINYLYYNGATYRYQSDKFTSNMPVSWSKSDLSPADTYIQIDFTSGGTWTWDCTSYDVNDLKVIVEFYK